MKNKISLDAIITEEATKFSTASLNPNTPGSGEAYVLFATNCMKEAIRQALELASEKATYYHKIGSGRTHIGVDKQSILDVNDLIT
jgi:hypothetical protein